MKTTPGNSFRTISGVPSFDALSITMCSRLTVRELCATEARHSRMWSSELKVTVTTESVGAVESDRSMRAFIYAARVETQTGRRDSPCLTSQESTSKLHVAMSLVRR